MALSGHWFRTPSMSALGGVKQTSLVRDRVSVNDPKVDLEENRACFNKGSSAGCEGIVPAFGPNHPAIPQIAGRDGLASDCQHSHHKPLIHSNFLVPGAKPRKALSAAVGKVRLAVIVGQPSEPGPYTIRVKVPSGLKLMPHRHPKGASEDQKTTKLSITCAHPATRETVSRQKH